MDSAHILQITLSRSYWLVWSRDGVHGKYMIHDSILLVFNVVAIGRCTARNNNLDGMGGHRSKELRDVLIDVLEPQVLWDGYGIVHDVVVCVFPIVLLFMYDWLTRHFIAIYLILSPCRYT